MNKPSCLAMLSLLFLQAVTAQSTIKGVVLDALTNQAVPGVTVSALKERSNTSSDQSGRFSLRASHTVDSIEFTSVGYLSKTVAVTAIHDFVFMTPAFTDLNEVIVSGNREVQKRTEVPVAVNVISKSTINDTKATRLDMLLNKVPGVYMVDLGNEQHEMGVRQPLGTKSLFLYLEDGIPIRTVGDFNHNALIEINQASMERIEVIKGPASSLYGSEAVGGAVNFITQAPSPFLTGKLQAETGSRGYKRTDFSVSDTYKRLGIFAGGYYARQSQPGHQHNDFNKAAITLRADYLVSASIRWSTVADYIRYKTDQKGGIDSTRFYNKDYSSLYRFTYRAVDAIRLRSSLSVAWSDNNKTTFTFFYRNSTITQNPFYAITNLPNELTRAKGQINEDAFQSYGTVLQHTTRLPAIKASLISGVSIDYSPATYRAQHIDVSRIANSIYYAYSATDSLLTGYQVDLVNTAVYTQLEYKPADNLRLVAAARYDRLDYTFDNHLLPGAFTGAPDAKDHYGHFTPKIGLTWDFGKNKGAYLNYSVGFAPPNISDLYTGVRVPILQSATYNNYELGGWISFAGKKGFAEVSLYKMDGKNEVVSTRLADGSYLNENAGKTSHNGMEANIKYTPVADLSLRLSGSFARHKYIRYVEQGKDYSNNLMAQAPPIMYNCEMIYKPHFLKGFRVAVEWQGLNKYYTDPQNTATYPGFTVMNVRTGYQLKGCELWLNCTNITDKIFATVVEKNAFGTSYRPGQLRTISIGFAYHFGGVQ